MLELIVLCNLCKKNINDERLRGRTGQFVNLYTIIIWVGFELLGFVLGASIARVFSWQLRLSLLWIFAFCMAWLGSQVTRSIARR